MSYSLCLHRPDIERLLIFFLFALVLPAGKAEIESLLDSGLLRGGLQSNVQQHLRVLPRGIAAARQGQGTAGSVSGQVDARFAGLEENMISVRSGDLAAASQSQCSLLRVTRATNMFLTRKLIIFIEQAGG